MQKTVDHIAEKEVLKKELELEKAKNSALSIELRSLKKFVFGAKTEKHKSIFVDSHQSSLFVDKNPSTVAAVTPKTNKQNTPKKKKKKKSIDGFFPNLVREEQVIEPKDLDLDNLKRIGEDVTEVLAYNPGSFYVIKIIRPKYAKNDGAGIVQANIPERIVPKGQLDDSTIAQLIVEKMKFHTPVHRFAKKMELQNNKAIAVNILQNGFHRAAEALSPLYNLLISDLKNSEYIQADESPIKVLNHNKKKKESKGYMWVYRNPVNNAVAFSYHPNRSTASADFFLNDFKGYLQTDGYTVYNKYGKKPDVNLIHCMAHARRKFVDAKDSDEQRASYFLDAAQKLYGIERRAKELKLSYDQRYQLRQKEALPILNKLKEWLDKQLFEILPKSAIGKAIAYTLNLWKGLCGYIDDGRLEIDNNLIENKIRPLALGRKNYMFAHNENTAQNLALLYSLIASCDAC